MKTPKISEALGNIPEDIVSEAVTYKRADKKKSFIKWGSIAACFMAVVMAAAIIVPTLYNDNKPGTISGIVYRDYKGLIGGTELDIDFPWEYKLINEKFPMIQYGGQEYITRGRLKNEALLGQALGTCTATGIDNYLDNNITYTKTFGVRKINGVSEERLVAVHMDGEYYVYFNRNVKCPATFGELLDAYSLSETLPLIKFSVNEGYKEKGYYQIADDEYIWQVLSECRDAEAYLDADSWRHIERNYLCFTATSDALGAYKQVFYITEDGYVYTNVFYHAYVYYIGEDAANKIITYAKSNATEAEREPYQYTLAGAITEIGDGYILLDDTVLCKKKKDGMVFKVLTDELIIRRYLECANIKVGDIVAVNFQSPIFLGDNNTASGAVSMYKGEIIDGNMAVAE